MLLRHLKREVGPNRTSEYNKPKRSRLLDLFEQANNKLKSVLGLVTTEQCASNQSIEIRADIKIE